MTTATIRRLSTHANVVKQLLATWAADIMAYEKQFQLRQLSQRVDPCSHYVASIFRDMIAKDNACKEVHEQRKTLKELLGQIVAFPEVVVPFFLKEVLETPEFVELPIDTQQTSDDCRLENDILSILDLMCASMTYSNKTKLIQTLLWHEHTQAETVIIAMQNALKGNSVDFSEAVAFVLANPYSAFTYVRNFDPNDALENKQIASNLSMVLGFLDTHFQEQYDVALPSREVGRKHKNRLAWLDEAAKTVRFAKPLVVRVHEMVQIAYP